jgi:hypothetical protein
MLPEGPVSVLLPSALRVEEQELGRSVLDASKFCPVPSVFLVGLRSVQLGQHRLGAQGGMDGKLKALL